LSACSACQYPSATTATAFSNDTTRTTPGIFSAAAPSTDTSLPPKTGDALMTAYNMFGSFTSSPYAAVPFTFDGMSNRCRGVPMIVNDFDSFSAGSVGGSSLAAALASSP
jgi:hypothetical protein